MVMRMFLAMDTMKTTGQLICNEGDDDLGLNPIGKAFDQIQSLLHEQRIMAERN